MSDLYVDNRLKKVLPEMKEAEEEALRECIKEDGVVLKPVITAIIDDVETVIDGMHRKDIAETEGIPYEIKRLETIKTLADAKAWMVKHALAGRQMPPQKLSRLRGENYSVEKRKPGRPKSQPSEAVSEDSPCEEDKKTVSEIAEATGVSERTLQRDEKYAKAMEALPAVLARQIDKGEIKASKEAVVKLAEYDTAAQNEVGRAVRVGQFPTLQDAMTARGMIKKKKQEEKASVWDDIAPGLVEQIKALSPGEAELKNLAKHDMDQQREIMKLIKGDIKTIGQALMDYEGDTISPRDDKKEIIPENLRPVFEDRWWENTEKALKKIVKEIRSYAQKTPWWKSDLAPIFEHLSDYARWIGDCQPAVICPECKGTGKNTKGDCGWCRGSGFMPAWAYNDWKNKKGKK